MFKVLFRGPLSLNPDSSDQDHYDLELTVGENPLSSYGCRISFFFQMKKRSTDELTVRLKVVRSLMAWRWGGRELKVRCVKRGTKGLPWPAGQYPTDFRVDIPGHPDIHA